MLDIHDSVDFDNPQSAKAWAHLVKQILQRIRIGNGTPESSVAASIGTLYLRLDGGTSTSLYIKESGTGTTGWVAK